jgi:SAM-dependent methyltransferase
MSGLASVIWHDVECGGYAADLELWQGLAAEAGGTVLDLGCGTGRVGLHLARLGHEVLGLDSEPDLVATFNQRADAMPRAEARLGDARDLALGREFALVIAPMQLAQLFSGPCERVGCLEGIAAHLRPGGVAALAIAEEVLGGESDAVHGAPLPDTREVDGRVYSSLPLATLVEPEEIVVRRLRQTVSVDGLLEEEENTIRLSPLGADRLELEAGSVGLVPQPRRYVPPTDDHIGSTVVVLRREA